MLYARAGDPKGLRLADGAGHTQVFDHYPELYRARATHLVESIAP